MRILARLVGPIACLGLPTAALGQTDTSETNPQVLEGLQAVNPSVTVVSSAPDQFSEENMQNYLTFQFAVSLENLGLDIEEDAPRIECSVSLSEARDEIVEWSYRVALHEPIDRLTTPERDDSETIAWMKDGTSASPSPADPLDDIPVWGLESCVALFKIHWVPANPPADGLDLVTSPRDGRFSVAIDNGRFYLLGDYTRPGLRIVEPARDVGFRPTVTDLGIPDLGSGGPIVVRGALAYLIVESGLRILDLSDVSSPAWLGSYDWDAPPGSWSSLAVSGSLAVLAHSRGTPRNRNVTMGVSLIDVGDPAAPHRLGSLNLPAGSDNVGDLAVVGSMVYVAARLSGLYIFDAADPTAPALLAQYEPGSWSRGVLVNGSFVYLSVSMTRNSSAIHVLDVSDPARPVLVRKLETPGPAQQMALMDQRLYVADSQAGLRVYDVSEPSEPVLTARRPIDDVVGEVAAADGLVAVLGGSSLWLFSKEGQPHQQALSIPVNATPVLQPSELCSDHTAYAIATFEDGTLEAAIRAELALGAQEDLTCGLISGLTSLGAPPGIESLVGIQNLTGLVALFFNFDNSITDISPLRGLTSLSFLDLAGNSINSITDISVLSGLTNLNRLELRNNPITDIQPLLDNTGLTAGARVGLQGTNVSCTDVAALEAKGVTVISDCPGSG